jgi:hypothetical protein
MKRQDARHREALARADRAEGQVARLLEDIRYIESALSAGWADGARTRIRKVLRAFEEETTD